MPKKKEKICEVCGWELANIKTEHGWLCFECYEELLEAQLHELEFIMYG